MKQYSFLPKLKYFAIVFAALVICVAACYNPPPPLEISNSTPILVKDQPLLHIGKGQPALSTYVSLDQNSNVFYRIHKDDLVLDLTYKSDQTKEVTLKLYDALGSLQHMEKFQSAYMSTQRSLALGHLKAGTYELQLSTQCGIQLSQAISLHTDIHM